MVNLVNIEIEFNSFEQIGEYEIDAEMAKSCKVILIKDILVFVGLAVRVADPTTVANAQDRNNEVFRNGIRRKDILVCETLAE